MREISLPAGLPIDYTPIIGAKRVHSLRDSATSVRHAMGGQTIWVVNSTASGGGVAEMLQAFLPYCDTSQIGVRWLIVEGDDRFFSITKRLCNKLYGIDGDGGPLSEDEHHHYRTILEMNLRGFIEMIQAGDVVILHDPQTAGMVRGLTERRANTIWRCHVGCDVSNESTEIGWSFLRPYLESAHSFVFSTQRHVPNWLDDRNVRIVRPSLDPFSSKNAELDDKTVTRVLTRVGILAGNHALPCCVALPNSTVDITREVTITREGEALPPDVPTVVQISRWDRLKDMEGLLQAFDMHVDSTAILLLAGPNVAGVSDDPEGRQMFEGCYAHWRALPLARRMRIQLLCLPMDDLHENALVVNALQRHASVVVQKSLAEGFGLTVTEAMWKGRPVIASAVGGIIDQIADGEHGILLFDPHDFRGCASQIDRLLSTPRLCSTLGNCAQARVRSEFLMDRHLNNWAELIIDARTGGESR
jgi:trehalose synthase